MISRRRFLTYGFGAASALLAPACTTRAQRKPANMAKSEPIAIIGAGSAGLSAALELQKRGFANLSIFEARDRLGGRIHTVTAQDGTLFEMGAGWVHGHLNNSIYDAMRDRQYPLLRSSDDSDTQIWDASGKPLSRRVSRDRVEAFIDDLDEIRELARRGESLAQAINRLRPQPDLWRDHFLRSYVVETEAADLEELAARELPVKVYADGDDFIPSRGYSGFFQDVAALLPPIFFQTKVEQITLSNRGVRLSLQEKERSRQVDFAAVVCTLPLGVLKAQPQIFDLSLPAAKQKAIQQIGFGHFAKLFLRFPQIFWPKDARWMERLGAPDRVTQFFPLNSFTGSKTLIGIAGGRQARRWETTSPEVLADAAMKQLREQFGKSIPDPVEIHLTNWTSEEFTRGAYSFPTPTSTIADIENLAAPIEERLYFAGEATSTSDYGTVHGAWDSGRRAAAQIHRVFS